LGDGSGVGDEDGRGVGLGDGSGVGLGVGGSLVVVVVAEVVDVEVAEVVVVVVAVVVVDVDDKGSEFCSMSPVVGCFVGALDDEQEGNIHTSLIIHIQLPPSQSQLRASYV
jgi:hypothetical protein